MGRVCISEGGGLRGKSRRRVERLIKGGEVWRCRGEGNGKMVDR